jgi:hypothetical protein
VACLLKQAPFLIKIFYYSSCGLLFEYEILGAVFPQIHISISYLGHRLLQVILIIAVRDCVTSWSYQESSSVHSAQFYILILCLLLWSWSFLTLSILHRKLFPIYSLSLTIDNLVCGWIFGSSSPWIVSYCLILLPTNLCCSHVSSLSLWKMFW